MDQFQHQTYKSINFLSGNRGCSGENPQISLSLPLSFFIEAVNKKPPPPLLKWFMDLGLKLWSLKSLKLQTLESPTMET